MTTITSVKKEKAFSELTKVERRALRLEQHYASLQRLYDLCGGGKLNGARLSSKLLHLEQQARRITTMQCNGEGNYEHNEQALNTILESAQQLFNGILKGLFINGDARGYALKLKDGNFKPGECYAETGLHTDFGGYGILAPEINGDY